MSRVRRNHIKRTEYTEQELPEEEKADLSETDEELAARIEARRRAIRKNSTRKKRRTVILMILVFAVLLVTCSREIVRLKAENIALKRQHAQLMEERDRLNRELGHVNDRDYIKNQARKQLRLLDPGEKMFIFEDGRDKAEESQDEEAPQENAEGEAEKESVDDKG